MRLENAVASVAVKAEGMEKELAQARELMPGYKAKAEAGFTQVEQVRVAEAEELRLRRMVEKFKTADDEVRAQMLLESQQEEMNLFPDSAESLGEKGKEIMEQVTTRQVMDEMVPEQITGKSLDTQHELPTLSEAMEQVHQETGISSWGSEFDEEEILTIYDDVNYGLTNIEVRPLYNKNDAVEAYLLETPAGQKRFNNVKELTVGVQSSYLEYTHRELAKISDELSTASQKAWDSLGKTERELFKVGNTEAEILGKMQERERVIEGQVQKDFKRLRSAEQEFEEAGFFSRSAKREALEQVKAEVQGKYHGATQAYEGMKWAKEMDEELSLWDKKLTDVRARKASLMQDSADARLRVEKADSALKQVQGKAEAVKQERVQVDPVLRAQKVRGAGAARELAGSRGADVQRVQGMVR